MTTLGELLNRALDARLADVHVSMPGRVETYDAATQTADVQPLLKRALRDEDGEIVETLPLCPGVPVLFPRAGDWFVSLPLSKGDTVLLVFAERSLDQWLERGGEVDPGDLRMHSLDGAVAIPGVYPRKERLADVHAENLVLGRDGGVQIHLRPDGTLSLGEETPGDWLAMAAKVLSELQKAEQDLNDLKTAITAWVPVPADGGAALKAALVAWCASPVVMTSVASAVVRSA
jgi:hypothetical protein